jgi:hypothetical protein
LARFTLPRTVAEDETGISSSGFATEVRYFRDRLDWTPCLKQRN